jgi:hypothetical protein
LQKKAAMRKVFFEFLRKLKITHLIFTGIQLSLLIAGIMLAGNFSELITDPEHLQLLRIVSFLSMITAFTSGLVFLKHQLQELQDVEGITEKLNTYSNLIIIRSLIWLVSNAIAFFCVLIFADMFIFATSGLMIFLSNLHYPFRKKVLSDLQLTNGEMHLIREIRSFA